MYICIYIGLDNRHYIVDLARSFPPESPNKAQHLQQNRDFKVGQRVYVIHPCFNVSRSYQEAIILSIHEVNDPLQQQQSLKEKQQQQQQQQYNIVFQSDKLHLSNVPESCIKIGLYFLMY
jgi:hypothetical protein